MFFFANILVGYLLHRLHKQTNLYQFIKCAKVPYSITRTWFTLNYYCLRHISKTKIMFFLFKDFKSRFCLLYFRLLHNMLTYVKVHLEYCKNVKVERFYKYITITVNIIYWYSKFKLAFKILIGLIYRLLSLLISLLSNKWDNNICYVLQ